MDQSGEISRPVNTGMTLKESLFCCIIFMIKDKREITSKKIFHDLLPQSIISVRKMIGDLDLIGKVTTSLEPSNEFWKSNNKQSSGFDPVQATQTTHTPIENNCIVLRISGNLLKNFQKRRTTISSLLPDQEMTPLKQFFCLQRKLP